MLTIEYNIPKKLNLTTGTLIIDKVALDATLAELDKHELLSSSAGEWLKYTDEDYFLTKIDIKAQNAYHLVVDFIYLEKGTHSQTIDTRFYKLKTK